MDVEITPESIDRTHRLGKKQQNTGRPWSSSSFLPTTLDIKFSEIKY